MFIGATVSEIAGGPLDPPLEKMWVPKGLDKGRVKGLV